MLEIDIMRIIIAGRMGREMNNVMVGLRLLVRGHVIASQHGAPFAHIFAFIGLSFGRITVNARDLPELDRGGLR
jgi:hypothetical protein